MPLPVYSTAFLNGKGYGEYVITGAEGVVSLISCIDAHIGSTPDGGNFVVTGPAGQVLGSTVYLPIQPQNFTYRGKIILQPGESLTLTCKSTVPGEDPFDCTVSGDALTIV